MLHVHTHTNLNVLPDGVDDVSPSGCVNTQKLGQFTRQLVLCGLHAKRTARTKKQTLRSEEEGVGRKWQPASTITQRVLDYRKG